MKKRMITAVSLAVCMAAVTCACGSDRQEDVFTGEKADVPKWQTELDMISPEVYGTVDDLDLEPGTYISVIGKTSGTPYWNQIKAGVEQAAKDINDRLGYTGEDKIKILFNAPSDGEDIDEQVNILDEEMARYPDVIAIASIDEDASAVQFDLAIENGIGIVAFDSGNSYQGIQCTVMTDNSEAAAAGARKLCESIEESGEVALIALDSVSGNVREREEAFKKEIADSHPGVSVAEVIYMDQLDELKQKAAAEKLNVTEEELATWIAAAAGEETSTDGAAQEQEESISEEAKTRLEDINSLAGDMSDEEAVGYYLEKHPDLKGCFGTNDEAVILAADAVEEINRSEEITVMGFDVGKAHQELLQSGKIDGLIVQNPFGIGYAAVVAAARTVLEIGNEAVVDTGYTWVDRDNLEDSNIQAILYE